MYILSYSRGLTTGNDVLCMHTPMFFLFFFCFILFPFDNLFGLLYISCLLLRINSIGLIIGRCAAARLEEAIAVELNTNVKIDGSNPLEHVVVIPRRHHRRPLTILLLTQ